MREDEELDIKWLDEIVIEFNKNQNSFKDFLIIAKNGNNSIYAKIDRTRLINLATKNIEFYFGFEERFVPLDMPVSKIRAMVYEIFSVSFV